MSTARQIREVYDAEVRCRPPHRRFERVDLAFHIQRTAQERMAELLEIEQWRRKCRHPEAANA